jgi:hypothetical protein
MPTALDEGERDVAAGDHIGEAAGGVPGHVGVVEVVEEAHRARERDGRPEEEVPPSLLDQSPGHGEGWRSLMREPRACQPRSNPV